MDDVRYEWDRTKANTSWAKHGVVFADAVSVFTDDLALTIEDDEPSEQRFVTIGMDALGRVLVVVDTWRSAATIRIISVRRASRTERREYEQGI